MLTIRVAERLYVWMSEKALTASRGCLQWKDVAKLAAFRLAVNPPL
jgi:hypothetical protein